MNVRVGKLVYHINYFKALSLVREEHFTVLIVTCCPLSSTITTACKLLLLVLPKSPLSSIIKTVSNFFLAKTQRYFTFAVVFSFYFWKSQFLVFSFSAVTGFSAILQAELLFCCFSQRQLLVTIPAFGFQSPLQAIFQNYIFISFPLLIFV